MSSHPIKRRIGLVSLGCAKNLVDSEGIIKQLETEGHQVFFDPDESLVLDDILINTCGFIGDAKQESIDTILYFTEAKKRGTIDRIFVMGCLSQRYQEQLEKEIPEVTLYVGVAQWRKLIHAIGGTLREDLLGERTLTTPSHYAYLKIAEGCNRKCSFCAIPLIRGKHVSKPIENIISEAELLAGKGVRELHIISQDTTYYGLDLYGKRRLGELLQRLSEIRSIQWIRLHYTHPHAFPMEVLDIIRENPKLCKYLDIPLQHISDHILHKMKRGLHEAQTRKLVEKIRKKVPGIAIRTTLMVGFPGETEADFRKLKAFVEVSRFDRLGVFTYSQEEDTSAFLLGDPVPEKVKQKRAAELMSLQEEISMQLNQKKIGYQIPVMIDKLEGASYVGRTQMDSPEVDHEVFVGKTNQKVACGTICQVRITDASPFELYGEIVN